MPTTSSETTNRSASLQDAQSGAFVEAQHLLAESEASGERAISEAVQAFGELVRAVLPGVVTQPARAVDLALELMQQSLNLQRRLLHEMLATLQVAVVEAGWDDANVDGRATGSRSAGRRRAARKAA